MKHNLAFFIGLVVLLVGCLTDNIPLTYLGALIIGITITVNYIERSVVKGTTKKTNRVDNLKRLLQQWDVRAEPRASYLCKYLILAGAGALLMDDAVAVTGNQLLIALGYLAIVEIPVDYIYRKTQRRLIRERMIDIDTFYHPAK